MIPCERRDDETKATNDKMKIPEETGNEKAVDSLTSNGVKVDGQMYVCS